MNKYTVSYSQNREDIILRLIFRDIKEGFYVDVGAGDPTYLSVTKLFYDRGWRGVNIEPNKHLIDLLNQERKRDINISVGVSNKEGTLEYREYEIGYGLSTFSDKLKQEYNKNPSKITSKYTNHKLQVSPLKDVLGKHELPPVNFMKIDVEGFEYEVLSGNDWSKYRPQILCIEANHIRLDWHQILTNNEYTKFFFDGLNEYFVANEHKDLIKDFRYEEVLDKPIIPELAAYDMDSYKDHVQQMSDRLIRQELVTQALAEQIHELNAQLGRNKRFRSLIKQLFNVTNQIILIRIEKLNKPRVHRLPLLEIPPNQNNASLLINKLQTFDFQSYYLLSAHPSIRYSILKSFYVYLSKLIRSLLIVIYKLMNKGLSYARK